MSCHDILYTLDVENKILILKYTLLNSLERE